MGHEIQILTEAELRAAVKLDLDTVDVIARAFLALAGGEVVMPPIMSMEIGHGRGEVDAKTAWIPGFDGFALKVSTGFYGNAELGLPSLGGLMVLFSSQTGQVRTVLLDNGYLTDIRTAAAGAVAARALAPENARVATVFGTGLQARLQAEAAALVRPLERFHVWGRDAGKAVACAADITARTGIAAAATADPGSAVAASELVITTTPAREPVFRAEWMHPGLHITAMGSDMSEKQELEATVLAAADLYVADRVSQCEALGELRSAIAAGVWTGATPPELGEVLAGAHPGRTHADQVTIADLTGTGAQDTAIATHVAARLGTAGTVIPG
jgi:ornithine cyclodeaminase